MHYVGGRKPRGRAHKKVCDVIHGDLKLLNLSNEDAKNRTVWSRAIKPKKSLKHTGNLFAYVDSGS